MKSIFTQDEVKKPCVYWKDYIVQEFTNVSRMLSAFKPTAY